MNMNVQQAGTSNVGKMGKVGKPDEMDAEGGDKMAKIMKLLEELLKMLAQDSRASGDEKSGGCGSGSGGPAKAESRPGGSGGAHSGGAQGGGSANQPGGVGNAVGSQSTPNDLPSDKKATIDRAEQDFDQKYGKFMQPGEKDKANFQIANPGAGNAGLTTVAHGGKADDIKLAGDMNAQTLYHVAGHEKAHATMSKQFESAFGNGPGSKSAIEGGAEMLANSATPEKGFNNAYYAKGFVANAEKARNMAGEDTFSKAFFSGDAGSIQKVKQAFISMGAE